MKNLLYILLLLPIMAVSQTNTQNYVKTLVYKDATATSDATKANATVTYYDGLGRPVQQIAGKQSGTGKDIITHIEYDGFSRQPKEYLPYAATTDNLAFDASAQANTVAFYNTAAFENTINPYSEKFFEASPLSRVMKQGAPGTPWLGNTGNDNDRTVKFAYLLNTSEDAVKNFTATTTWNSATKVYDIALATGTAYGVGKLYKTITQDENKASAVYTGTTVSSKLNTTEEFKNQQGQLLLKRTFNQEHGQPVVALDTYYVYDQFGNLTYVLPPLATGTITQTILDKLCYQYKYDSRNRMAEKKLPGKAWEFMVYDSQDRIVATGPALNPWGSGTTGWMVNKYDAFGRVAYTGWYSETSINSTKRLAFQGNTFSTVTKTTSATLIDNVSVYYTNSFPTTMKVLSINYYDNYTYAGAPTSTVLTTPIEGQSLATNYKGLATGSWVRALTTESSTTGETTYTLYDAKSRPVRTRTTTYLGGYTETDSKLDFDGTVQYAITRHKRISSATELVTRQDYTYTAQDRLLSETHTIGSQSAQLMAYNDYNAIGQLKSKKVGNTSTSPLQQVDYTYNIRGWMIGINNILELNNGVPPPFSSGQPQDLFAFKINYNSTIDQNMGGQVVPLYNGNIAETSWRTASDNIQRRYGYTYDKLNRLTDAWYQVPQSSMPVRNSYDERLKYDANGNIISLKRNGELDSTTTVTEIDDLTYYYDGNQLIDVYDDSGHPAGFNDQNIDDDYSYDAYGNLLTDYNKGIHTDITYNHLNLPITIVINDGTNIGTISYLYDAAGVKLKKTVMPSGGSAVVTDYLGGYQYMGGVLEFFPTSEGYVKNTVVSGVNNYNYVFQYRDHLGNNRISYTKDPADNVLKILEEDHYYPFGLKHNGYSATQQMLKGSSGIGVTVVPVITAGDATYKYMYNGKELQDELGLNNYDFGARNYDPAIGRWMNIDPKAETSRRWSPYVYAYNNSLRFVDPDGMQNEDWVKVQRDNGNWAMIYDSEIHSLEDAKKKGYDVGHKGTGVMSYAHGTVVGSGEEVEFFADGTYKVNGEKYDVDDTAYFTKSGLSITENKGIWDAFGDYGPKALQDGGDAITLAAAPVGMTGVGLPAAEVMAGTGGAMSFLGTGLELVNDMFEGKFSWEKAATKLSLEYISNKLGGSDVMKPVEKIINDNVFNGLDRIIDEIDDQHKIF